jgi:RNA-directed DNA polymerase
MKKLIELTADEARNHFLKGSSYFNSDLPDYISFEPILKEVNEVLNGSVYKEFNSLKPSNLPDVNYSFITNKDGRFAWRPYEFIHPVIYVSLVNLICDEKNWQFIKDRFQQMENSFIDCCSSPVISENHQSDVAAQINNWWQKVEQRSLIHSLNFSHLTHTDVTNCYGSLYTHSISWALHGKSVSKECKNKDKLLGNQIDSLIRDGRYGQTNGISQGSVLMDLIAELVLGYIDEQIYAHGFSGNDIQIIRYRDDYRIFSNSDHIAENALKVLSDKLQMVGMVLGVPKTFSCKNVVEGSVKPDKISAINLQDLGTTNAQTLQKQFLRLHTFGLHYPNSGALKRLVSNFHDAISSISDKPNDLKVLVAIAVDIAFVSPSTFPVIAGILSHLISLAAADDKLSLWNSIRDKMSKIPHNGYLEIWLQRVIKPKSIGIQFDSKEPICRVVNGNICELWNSTWILDDALKAAMEVKKILISDPCESSEIIKPKELELFKNNALSY